MIEELDIHVVFGVDVCLMCKQGASIYDPRMIAHIYPCDCRLAVFYNFV